MKTQKETEIKPWDRRPWPMRPRPLNRGACGVGWWLFLRPSPKPLRAMRGVGESFRDVILRLASERR